MLRRTVLTVRKIQKREATAADMRREVAQSAQSVFVYMIGACFLIWGREEGIFYDVFGVSFGIGVDLLILAAIIIAHDAYFYWAHRLMHHPRLFRYFHRAHHRSITPTPWAAYSFAMPEAAAMFLFVPLWLFFVPTPGWVMVVWLNFQIIRNAMGHAGFEFFPRWWLDTPLTRWINTTVHHDLHHNGGFNSNFGLYFTWWDKWMGTEHPRYHEKFREVTVRTQANAAMASSEVTASTSHALGD
ncbi:sterol desaturase family protein [Blastomonas sp. CCH8-A3]|nr:sterol desaturase family protein [Blastomonas sp. CCH8-A3]